MYRILLSILSLLITGFYTQAQVPVMSVGGNISGSEVYLQKLKVNVDVVGNIATTCLTMTFKNRTSRTQEGDLTFPLPEGATVSGYALDINGKMRNAVPVDKAKGTQVFEEIERRRVDPGLLEKVEGNNFRTRVYPILSNATRTVSISYEQELLMTGNALHYRLPMDYKEKIEQFSLSATVWKANNIPQLEEKLADEIVFDKEGANYVAKFSRQDYMPQRALAIALPKLDEVAEVLMLPAGSSYYFLVNSFIKSKSIAKQWSNNIGIVWDASLSGLQRDTKKELDLLDAMISQKKDLTIRVALLNNVFSNAGVFNISNGNWSELRKMLESVVYDGGTNFSAIKLSQIPSDEYILFSDGISSFGDENFQAKNIVHCIVSTPKANYSNLKWIAAKSGGKFINLNELSQIEAKDLLTQDVLQFMGIKSNSDVSEVYPSTATNIRNGNISVAGITDANNTFVTLLFGIGGKVTQQQTVQLDASKYKGDVEVVSRMWAQKKIAEMDIQYEKNKEDIIALGQQFGIVTRGTSLIVLETVQDYITYNIAPPQELANEYNQYMQAMKGRNTLMSQRLEGNFLDVAKVSAKDLKIWWNTSFKTQAPKYPKPDNIRRTESVIMADAVVGSIAQADMRAPAAAQANRAANDVESKELAEVVVTGDQVQRKKTIVGSVIHVKAADMQSNAMPDALQGRVPGLAVKEESTNGRGLFSNPVITIADIKQDKDYLKTLTGDVKKDYEQYLSLRKNYSTTAAFYFDMARWFCKHKDTTTALRILSSIAELDLENAGLFKTLAFRLKEYGDYDDALFVAKKIMEWRPMEPQSYRDYALALADAGQYQAALDTLYGALIRSYPQTILRTNYGIVETYVAEINQLIALHGKKLNTRKIDTALIKAMPVDVRVVLSWNMNDTDIDLHVTDANGEQCYYSHSRTAIGGRLSADVTTGYGPEQFQLKKAVKGKYKIEVNYFGDRQIKNEGPSTLMAEIYTNYANGQQQRKIVSLQMSPETKASANGKVLVGEFSF